MPPKKIPQPTPAELAILQVLWQLGSATVREIHTEINKERASAYTTTLKFLQIMLDKGLVTRNDDQRSHVYTPIYSEEQIQSAMAGDLLHRVFGGSPLKLVMQALGNKKASPKELAEIRKLLDDMEQKKK